jgi:hypothetical protein
MRTEQEIEDQIREKQQTVDYDIKEYPVEVIVRKYVDNAAMDENEIFIPAYQRSFVWEEERQSKFIESLLLGLPIPYIFTAENHDGRLEVVDGSQRIRTLQNFLSNNLKLVNLEFLSYCNGMRFGDFTISRQRKINNTSLRMIVLSEKSDEDARYMLFERINSGSVLLEAMEKRKGSFKGPFTDFIYECSQNPLFIELTSFTPQSAKRGEPQELVLRYFAYSESLDEYSGYVNEFLDTFNKKLNDSFDKAKMQSEFNSMLKYVKVNFPNGFIKAKNHTSTPRVRFEAISVGVTLALRVNSNPPGNVNLWIDSKEFNSQVTGSSTNTPVRLKARINYVKDRILGL